MDYKKAGVDIEAGYKSVELMKEHVKRTMREEVLGGLGGFSGAFSLKKIKDMDLSLIHIQMCIRDRAVTISTDMDDLVDVITDQNFVPVIDDQEKFIGIVTRKDVIRFYHDEYRKLAKNE